MNAKAICIFNSWDCGRLIPPCYAEDLSESNEILLPEWKKRPKLQKLAESFARLFGPLM